MHEWALADAVIAATVNSLGGRDASCLRSATVFFGELQAIDKGIFAFALETLLAKGPFSPSVFRLETEKAAFRCTPCGCGWTLAEALELTGEQREAIHFLPEAAHAFLRCPSCGSPDYVVERGRGVRLASIEVEESVPMSPGATGGMSPGATGEMSPGATGGEAR
jgi:hydrogenase nickel incorporation protein HypA/HybF